MPRFDDHTPYVPTGLTETLPAAPPGLNRKRHGRPPVRYKPELMETILSRMSHGETLRAICRSPGMPKPGTVHQWVRERPELLPAWLAATHMKSHSLIDECLDYARILARQDGKLATQNQIKALSVAIDTIRDLAGKLNPRDYGPRSTAQTTIPIQIVTNMNLGQEGEAKALSSDDAYTITIDAKPDSSRD